MTPFIAYDMPAAEYHARPEISNSQMSDLARSPAHFWALHRAPQRPERVGTAAMELGTLVHLLVLEPQLLSAQYCVADPSLNLRKKADREQAEQQAAGRITISADDLAHARAMSQAILRLPCVAESLNGGRAESSVFWTDSATGVDCRARPDLIGRRLIIDVKTTRELTPDAVSRAVASYGYHRQAAHYMSGLRACGMDPEAFVFAFVSSSYPYLAGAFVLDDETMQQGDDEVAELLSLYAECESMGRWPGFDANLQSLALPVWAKRSNEIEVGYV